MPLGVNDCFRMLERFDRVFFMLFHDLAYVTRLAGDAPYVYFRFHMLYKDGLMRLFDYRNVILLHQDPDKDVSVIL